MNVQEIINRVKRTFGDESGVQINDSDIIAWINEAQQEIVNNNSQILEDTSVTDIIKDQMEYDAPLNMSILKALYYDNSRLRYISLQDFNEFLDRYQDPKIYTPGIPEVYTMWANKFRIFPRPSQDLENGLKLEYVSRPNLIQQPADTLEIPEEYHNSIITYCLSQAYELDEDLEKTAFKANQFESSLSKLRGRKDMSSTETYPRISIIAEEDYLGGYY